MKNFPVKLIGLYSVDENPEASLLELLINRRADQINIEEFTQEIQNEPRNSWQAPFGEKYLSLDGETIIGDDFDLPKFFTDTTRITFFIYFLNPAKPLLTPFGQLLLTKIQAQPQRIKDLIKFEDPE